MTRNQLFKEIMKREAGKSQMKIHHLREAWKIMVVIEIESFNNIEGQGHVSYQLAKDFVKAALKKRKVGKKR